MLAPGPMIRPRGRVRRFDERRSSIDTLMAPNRRAGPEFLTHDVVRKRRRLTGGSGSRDRRFMPI